MKIANWKIFCLIICLLITSVVGGLVYSERVNALPADAVASYVGGQKCITCHQDQADSFHHSHHDLAMDVAKPETVLGEFDGTKIEHYGIVSTVFMDGDRYMVNTEGPDGTMKDFEVTMVFGYEPLQQYMVELEPPSQSKSLGKYHVLRISWDVINKQWFYLSPPDVNEKLEPGDPLHWTGISQRWNTNCAPCHSTNLQKNFDASTGKYATTFTDIDVNCEACHGPGSLHVAIAEKRRFFWDKNHGFGLAKLKSTSNLPQIESCAPCHSRRAEICSGFQAGKRFDDYFACQILSDQIYHDDGQIRDEDYVYGSFVQSKMYHKGIRCTDCHDPHSAKLKHNGNQVCTSCHQHPAGKYDSPAHHRHAIGSTGAQCVECHMPSTTYMAIDPRRDHSFRVPRPDLSTDYGVPNACSACHIDAKLLPEEDQQKVSQYLDWIIEAENGNETVAAELQKVNKAMAKAFKEWYPDAANRDSRSKYYEDLAIAKSNDKEAASVANRLAVDNSAPSIFRASAIEELIFESVTPSDELFRKTLADEDPVVIATALRLVEQQLISHVDQARYSADDTQIRYRIKQNLERAANLLDHEFRHVRIAAARTMLAVPNDLRSIASSVISSIEFQNAKDEYIESLKTGDDIAANQMILGGLYESNGQIEKAESAYRSAMIVEPEFSGPRSNLANLLEIRVDRLTTEAARGNNSTALAKRIEELSSEAKRLRVEENQLLRKDVQRAGDLPGAHGLFYRYGLSCYLMGDLDSAAIYLKKAYDLDSTSIVYTLGLAAFFQERKNYTEALPLVNKLIEANPDHPGFKAMRDEILAAASQ